MATPIQRFTNLVGALIDGTPTAPVVLKRAQIFWDTLGPDKDGSGNPIVNPTNAQLATFGLKCVRKYCQNVAEAKRVTAAAEAARLAELATVATETDTELGTT